MPEEPLARKFPVKDRSAIGNSLTRCRRRVEKLKLAGLRFYLGSAVLLGAGELAKKALQHPGRCDATG